MTANPRPAPEDLRRLAAADGVATSYSNERREPVEVDAEVVIGVLGLLDVDAGTEADRRRELTRLVERDRVGVLAPTVAVRIDGHPRSLPAAAFLIAEDGAKILVRTGPCTISAPDGSTRAARSSWPFRAGPRARRRAAPGACPHRAGRRAPASAPGR